MENKPFAFGNITFKKLGAPRYQQLAQAVENAIRDGKLSPGERIPPVRELARELGLSVTTVTSAFDLLGTRQLIRAQVGRGTFVSEHPVGEQTRPAPEPAKRQAGPIPWRRRALMLSGTRLRSLHPAALDCSTGRPDVNLLPLCVLKRAWSSVIETTVASDLQYAGAETSEPLAGLLSALLTHDNIGTGPESLLIGSSAQQLMMLSLEVAGGMRGAEKPAVAVEEPGYPTIMDAFERAGARLIPVAVDEQGAVPESLDRALSSGAHMALLTPAAHNPTGASWSPRRRSALADVLADHRGVVAVEDDQFAGMADARPGSLLNDERVADRVVYIRSFSKSIGPDLRIAVAAAKRPLRTLLGEAKTFADGWTSRLLQKTLAATLASHELPGLLARAREAYRQRRWQAAQALNGVLHPHGGWTWCGADGLNLWVHLPPGSDATEVAERAAAAGIRVAPGEPFFIRPGHNGVIRLNAGSVPADKAREAGRITGEAALASRSKEFGLIHV